MRYEAGLNLFIFHFLLTFTHRLRVDLEYQLLQQDHLSRESGYLSKVTL
jgi:hypothetical protein